jgi:hypothetical protein
MMALIGEVDRTFIDRNRRWSEYFQANEKDRGR